MLNSEWIDCFMYIGDNLDIDIVTDLSTTNAARDWTILVSQLECDPNMLGCFQYFTGRTGKMGF